MLESLDYRLIIKSAKVGVTAEAVRKELIRELGHRGDVRLESYEVEREFSQFEVENDPNDNYYLRVTSVRVKYFFRSLRF